MLLRQFLLGNLPTHIRENIDFPGEKPRRLRSGEANFKSFWKQKKQYEQCKFLF